MLKQAAATALLVVLAVLAAPADTTRPTPDVTPRVPAASARIAQGPDAAATILKSIDLKQEQYSAVAKQIWDYAELGFQEDKSSALLQKTLADAGFTVDKGVAGMPTAFTASYGSGKPVIAIVGEFDALPGAVASGRRVRRATRRRPGPRATPAVTTCSAPRRRRPPSPSRSG